MKKFILSFALCMGLTTVHNSCAVTTPAGYESAQFIAKLANQQNTTDSSIMRKLILMKLCPLSSLLGALYFGAGTYATLSDLERVLDRNPEWQKLSPNVKKAIKITLSSTFALFGAWSFARGYQQYTATDAMLFNPAVIADEQPTK